MAERIIDPRLQELYDKGCEVYSISRLNSLSQCLYCAWKKYINHEKEQGNCWSSLGGRVHDTLEACIHSECTEDALYTAIDDELENLDVLGMDFPLDRNGNPTIRNNWIKNMKLFAQHFRTPEGKFETEQLVLFEVRPNVYMQGYIDLIRYMDDGTIEIIDWKTSSQFQGDHLIEAGRQLLLYAMAKEREGFKVSKVRWVMIKYYEARWTLKNGKEKSKVGEWRNIFKELGSQIGKWMADAGYDSIDIDAAILQCSEDGDFTSLPPDIRNKFKYKIYVRDYPLTDELKQETLDYINKQIDLYQSLGTDEKNWTPNIDSFWCSSLCGFGREHECEYWNDYCDKYQEQEEEEDLF